MPELAHPAGGEIAFERSPGRAPAVVFLAGFRSDMQGTKALFLEEHCRRAGRAFVRFDYRGHGASSGAFAECTLGDWLEDALLVIDRLTEGPVVLVGSSMGGWLALRAAMERPGRVVGLVLIAPAPDFTERLILRALGEEQRRRLYREGVLYLPSDYGEPVPITLRLLEEGRRHLLLERPEVPIDAPVHILHGMRDPDVPWGLSLELAARLSTPHVTVELIGDGDHRLSRPEDLRRLAHALDRLLEDLEAGELPASADHG